MEYELIKVKPGEDLSEIIPLRSEIFGFGEDDLDECGISILLRSEGKDLATGRILLDMENDRLIIDMIGVVPDMRRQGIGTEVLDRLVDIAKDCRSEEVWAKTKNNREAMALLSKNGFEEMNFYWMCAELI